MSALMAQPLAPGAAPRRGLALAFRLLGAAVFYPGAFALALGLGAFLHVDLPAARRFALAGINIALSTPFAGKIVLENVAELRVGSARGLDARLVGADGAILVVARGARARVHPLALIESVLRGTGDLQVGVLGIDVESFDVCLDADETGKLKLQTALEPSPRGSSTSPGGGGRAVRLELPDVTVRHAFVHGRMKGIPPVDANLEALHGSLLVDKGTVQVDVTRVGLVGRSMPRGANPVGAVDVRVAIPSKAGRAVGVETTFDGTIGGIPATLRASLDGDWLDAVVDVPEVGDDKVRALLPEAPVRRPASAHAEAHGAFRSLHTTVRATMGAAQAAAVGDLSLDGPFAATVELDLRKVDLREMLATGPPSNLSAHADARFETKADGSLFGHFTLVAPPGDVGGQLVPAATMRGDFAQRAASASGAGDGLEVTMQGLVAEPGAPTKLTLSVRTDAPVPVVRFHADSHISWLANVKRVGGLGPGRAQIQLDGRVDLGSPPSFDATFDARVQALEHPPVYSDEAHLTAHAFGPFTDASVSAAVDADGIRGASYRFRHGRVTAEGPLSAERVTVALEGDGGPNVRARATVSLASDVRLRDVELELSRGRRALRATGKEVRIDPQRVRLSGGFVTGIGEPATASLDTRLGSLVVQAQSKGVDLEALGYLLGLEDMLRKGRLAFAIDLSARPDGADGSATADLEQGSFGTLNGLSGHVEAEMDGRKIKGSLTGALRGVAWLNVPQLDLDMGGKGPLDARSWRRTWGSVSLDGQIDLAKAAALLPADALPFSSVEGQLTVQGHVRRDDESDVTPDVSIALKTFGFRLAPRRAPSEKTNGAIVLATPAWNLSGIDLQLDAQADGETGFAEIAARVVDKQGLLLTLDAKSTALPYERLFASSDSALDLLKDVPFSALIVAPPRKLDRLPDILQPSGASGEAEARVAIEGTFRKPLVDATATARGARVAASPLVRGIDGTLGAKYDGASADLVLDAKAGKNGAVHGAAHVNARLWDFFVQPAALAPWDASAAATFDRFPLAAIAVLNDRQVRGQATGRVGLTNLHLDASAVLDLDVKDLTVGSAKPISGKLHATMDGHAFDSRARLEQNGAFVEASARVGTRWGASMTPSVDPSATAVASLQARRLPASFFAPFAASVLDELDGLIDADGNVALAPDKKPEMNGSITLRDGLVEVTALGQEFHAVNARVRLTPDGVLRLDEASASGTTGKLTASGVAHLDGLALVDVQSDIKIDRSDPVPLDLQGSPLGTVYGQFHLKANTSTDRQALTLNVDIPSLHVALPEASTHSVQELDEAEPQTHAGFYAEPGRFVLLPLDGFDEQQQQQQQETQGNAPPSSTLTVAVHLGQAVEMERGTELRVDMDGDISAKMASPTEVTGRVTLKGGKLDVQGKSFEIQSGTVTFVGDPSNPEVNVTAAWTASDGTRVYADYIGPLKTGKVILRSEPMRPQNEILALVLFGSADGLAPSSSSGAQTSTAQSAGTTVGGFASGGLSKGLDKLTGMQITAKVDTSQTYTKPEVAVQLARDISLQLAVVLGAPVGFDTTLATIDWRFLKNWSLETTFGNKGTSIADVIWQHRY